MVEDKETKQKTIFIEIIASLIKTRPNNLNTNLSLDLWGDLNKNYISLNGDKQ